jgi:hypothetical protein
MVAAGDKPGVPIGAIPPEDQVGRLGVMYVRSLLAQAALGNEETSSGEDHQAIDLTVKFRPAPVLVQVKAGRKLRLKDGTFSFSIKDNWRDSWAEAKIPVYLVYVHLTTSRRQSGSNLCGLSRRRSGRRQRSHRCDLLIRHHQGSRHPGGPMNSGRTHA